MLKTNSLTPLLLLGAVLGGVASCNSTKWQQEEKDGYILVNQKNGPALGYNAQSGVQILTVKGHAFKDLNKNGKLDVYEDWRKPYEERIEDLLSQLPKEELVGLTIYGAHTEMGGFPGMPQSKEPVDPKACELSDAERVYIGENYAKAFQISNVSSAEAQARWSNNAQALAEEVGHGIPINNSSDPRNEKRATAEYNAGAGGDISIWPSSIGMAATFDPSLVEKFGEVASKEYRALGITTALSPQIDLATEPRWSRFSGTFGEDPNLSADMARAYVDGFQNSDPDKEIKDGWGYQSVNAMVKHWPSGGPEEGGRDGHHNFGKFAVYPGNGFEIGLIPFIEGAFKLNGKTKKAAAVMPYYTISWGIDPSGENVGNNFSHYIVTDLLRDKYSYDGVVCTDWNITENNQKINTPDGKCWGMESATIPERFYKILKAGVDQFGGCINKDGAMAAYQMWAEEYGEDSARERFELSGRRLLMNMFHLGLFENPYLDPVESAATVGCPEFVKEGYEAQLKSIVMLKNNENTLPLQKKIKVYIPQRPVNHFESAFVAMPMNNDNAPGGGPQGGPQGGFGGGKGLQDGILPNANPFAFMFGGAPGGNEFETTIEKSLASEYFEVVDTPEEADAAIVLIQEPSTSAEYKDSDIAKGGNGYLPITLQYNDYTAKNAREESIAGGDPKESFTNRSYKGKTSYCTNKGQMELVVKTKKQMGDKPVIVVVSITKPMVMAEIEPYADALLLSYGTQNRPILETITGGNEPSGLLPHQIPIDMDTVETQCEDLPRDMKCYTDGNGNTYDFAFGLNWSGVINDERVAKYK